MSRHATLVIGFFIVSVSAPGVGGAAGQAGPWYEGFEGPKVSWHLVGGDAEFRVELHDRVRGEAHSGQGCERIRLVGGAGTEVLFGHHVGRPYVIDDLLPTVWVKADRPGIQLGAQLILPRTRHPQTGSPFSVVVYGTSYTMVGRWQQLRLDDVPLQLSRKTRALRAQFGPSVDPQQAFVERIVLNVYGGPGATNVWIDDLDIAGYVSVGAAPGPGGQAPAPDSWVSIAPAQPGSLPTPSQPTGAAGRNRIRLGGSTLLVDNRPVLPRALQHQGEPLDLVRQLGFNAVWLRHRPASQMLAEAQRLGLWLIVPPPFDVRGEVPGEPEPPLPSLGSEFDAVLAWDLGQELTARDLPDIRRWAEQVRLADQAQPGRPLVGGPKSDLRDFSRVVDILVLGRPGVGTTLSPSAFGRWLTEQLSLARPGTPLWTLVPTQPAESLRRQWATLRPDPVPSSLSSDAIQLLVASALSAGSRGILFESFSPLSAADPDTRTRALTLELVNLQLAMAEPWFAAGNLVAAIPTGQKGVVASVFQAEHGRLVVFHGSAQDLGSEPAPSAISLVVPGVPDSYSAYLLSPGGVRPVRHKRQTGGMRIELEPVDLGAMLLLTENPVVVAHMTRRVAQSSRRWAELQRELAATRLQTITEVLRHLPSPSPQHPQWLLGAQKALGQCDALLAARDEAGAYGWAVRAIGAARLVEQKQWERVVGRGRSQAASPGAVMFSALPFHAALVGRIAQSQPTPNLLVGGDFEDFQAMIQAGWRHVQHAGAVQCFAELTPSAAHSGGYGLRLGARLPDADGTPLPLESPPVWISSPPIPVQSGQIVLIRGWVCIPQPIPASVDGLLVVDSLAGEPLAERIAATTGWQEFALYRVVPESDHLILTFALTGLGEAWLDDVSVHLLVAGQAGGALAGPPEGTVDGPARAGSSPR